MTEIDRIIELLNSTSGLCLDEERRDLVAYLERLKEPTIGMVMSYWNEAGGSIPAERIKRGLKAALTAAGEGK